MAAAEAAIDKDASRRRIRSRDVRLKTLTPEKREYRPRCKVARTPTHARAHRKTGRPERCHRAEPDEQRRRYNAGCGVPDE